MTAPATGARGGDGAEAPSLSVVVPVHRCAELLPETLGALRDSDLPDHAWELIAVDDASGDRTPEVAGRYADRLVRVSGDPRGPAHARNRGAAAADGEILAFVDADVRVRPDTLRRLRDALTGRGEGAAGPGRGAASPDGAATARPPDAVFGSYDDDPPAPGVVSRYRNLLHHHVHQRHPGAAETFWAGCGAMRRSAFEAAGGFDDRRYRRPQIEDIELGRRLRALGHRIELRPEIRVTHLKRWTLGEVLRTDFRDRGVAWTRLLLRERSSGSAAGPSGDDGPSGGAEASGAAEARGSRRASRTALNLARRERWCAGLAVGATAVGGAGVALLAGAGPSGPESLAPLGIDAGIWLLAAAAAWVTALGVLQADFYRLLWRRGGLALLLGGAALHFLHFLTAAAAAVTGAVLHAVGAGES